MQGHGHLAGTNLPAPVAAQWGHSQSRATCQPQLARQPVAPLSSGYRPRQTGPLVSRPELGAESRRHGTSITAAAAPAAEGSRQDGGAGVSPGEKAARLLQAFGYAKVQPAAVHEGLGGTVIGRAPAAWQLVALSSFGCLARWLANCQGGDGMGWTWTAWKHVFRKTVRLLVYLVSEADIISSKFCCQEWGSIPMS